MGIIRNRFFKWGSESLAGHLVLFELLGGGPMLALALATMQAEDTLTPLSAMRIAFICAGLVAVCACLFWYTFSLPLIKSRNARK
jgi:hypothetical protein